MTAADQPRSGAQAVDRAIHVLNCFEGDDPELSVSELAHRAGLPVSTTYRLAQALVRGRLLEQDPATDRYRIGQGLAALARPALSRLGIDAAAPHLYALAAGIKITVSLSIADDRDAVTVFQARPPVYFCPNQLPRARQPLRSSAVGHALLAFAPVRAPADGPARQPTPLPPPDLDRVRRSGFAEEIIEREDPVRSVAVPILGPDKQVRGALGVQARSVRLNAELVRGIVPAMRQIAVRIAPLFDSTTVITDAPVELYSR
ncbi:IclR family transcriptional regulator [Nocardia sp. NPDC004604]|uniref:IclR family transcriptional regulator n=1 Tax=Nocardia sp. NPDC004604 TaxID=3157013 RepID=UPI0033BB9288